MRDGNISLTRKVVELKRYANKHLPSSESAELNVYGFYSSLALEDQKSGIVRVSQSSKDRLIQAYEAESRVVNDRYLNSQFLNGYRTYQTAAPYELSEHELASFLSLYSEWSKRDESRK